jgi:proteasome assembly chaperone 3
MLFCCVVFTPHPSSTLHRAKQSKATAAMAVQTTQGAFTIDGVHTELLISDYSNRLLVVVTQIGKLGTMYHAAGAGPGGGGGEGGGGSLLGEAPEVRTLVGRHDDEMLTAAARRLVQIVQGRGVSK